MIWKTNAILNVKHFIWRVGLSSVATKKNLQHINILIPYKMCVLCTNYEESCQHLIFECKVENSVLGRCYKWIGIIAVLHNKVMQNFPHFNMLGLNRKGNLEG